MSALNGVLRLHDVDDVEKLARRALDDKLRSLGAWLRDDLYDDFLAELIGAAWELGGRYDKTKGPSFATHCYRLLKLRVVDCYRRHFGDTRHGERPVVLSLDAPLSLRGDGDGGGDEGAGSLRDRLDEALASSEGDPAESRSPDLLRVLLEGAGGEGAGALEAVGQPPARGAAKRARSAKRVTPRIPPTLQDPDPPPRCSRCLPVFRGAFLRANNQRPEDKRLTIDEVEEQALKRAQLVRLGKQWACPRCSTVGASGARLIDVYPNRAARRRATRR